MELELIATTKKRELKNASAVDSFTVLPDDLNHKGSLFGGKILAEINTSGLKIVRTMLSDTGCDAIVTPSNYRVDFLQPAKLGDIVELTATIYKLGVTSVSVLVYAAKKDKLGHVEKICDAHLVFLSLKDGKPYPHNHYLQQDYNTPVELLNI